MTWPAVLGVLGNVLVGALAAVELGARGALVALAATATAVVARGALRAGELQDRALADLGNPPGPLEDDEWLRRWSA